ncbi:hypothetical protein [Parvicella tangerina]|nr:hypothetical protein [Parvicella tangerina]
MKQLPSGFYCDYCEKKVYDLGSISTNDYHAWRRQHPDKCVAVVESEKDLASFSLAKFALVLLLIGGGTFFNNISAQTQETILRLKDNVIQENSECKMLSVRLFNKKGNPISGSVWVVLPNGKELELLENKVGEYFVDVPHYCNGKEIQVYAVYFGKKKSQEVIMKMPEGTNVDFVFKKKRYKHYRHITAGF